MNIKTRVALFLKEVMNNKKKRAVLFTVLLVLFVAVAVVHDNQSKDLVCLIVSNTATEPSLETIQKLCGEWYGVENFVGIVDVCSGKDNTYHLVCDVFRYTRSP